MLVRNCASENQNDFHSNFKKMKRWLGLTPPIKCFTPPQILLLEVQGSISTQDCFSDVSSFGLHSGPPEHLLASPQPPLTSPFLPPHCPLAQPLTGHRSSSAKPQPRRGALQAGRHVGRWVEEGWVCRHAPFFRHGQCAKQPRLSSRMSGRMNTDGTFVSLPCRVQCHPNSVHGSLSSKGHHPSWLHTLEISLFFKFW